MSVPQVNLEMIDGQGANPSLVLPATEPLYYAAGKRMMDVLGVIIGFVILLPLFLIIPIWIKLEDPKGSILFKQVRVGKNDKRFVMYKFRSMVSNAEELLPSYIHLNETTGAMYKVKNDPRVTRVGRIIRKTSLDELPQFWNVLKGDMSLVGPRPPLIREVKQYTAYDKQRLLVKPGCTGLWQVSGRSKLGFDEMVQLDLEYIRTRNLWLDLRLICKTFHIMINSRDAY